MHYSRHINRPPDEASNILLQVTTGCSHNKCSFCKIYHDENFCMSPIEHVIEDLEALKRLKPTSKRVWLLNGDPFVLSYQKLVRIAELIHAHLDNIETIGMYVSIRNIKNKTVKELKHLRTLGMTGFHVGVESGDDDALKIATTGYNREDVYEQLSKLEQAGMDYQIGIIAGLGGSKTAIKVGKNTAELLNSLNPKKIIYNALFLLPGSRLENSKDNGEFNPPSEREFLQEIYSFIENYEGNSYLYLIPFGNPQRSYIANNKAEKMQITEEIRKQLDNFSIFTEQKSANEREAYKHYLFRI